MKKYILSAIGLACLAGAAYAQTAGQVWTYEGPTIGAKWVTPTGGASVPGTAGSIVTADGALGFGTSLVPGANVAAWLADPTGAKLLAALSTKTGTGLPVFGTAPTVTALTLGDITGSTQCLHVNTSGAVTGTGSDCGSGGGGSGTVTSVAVSVPAGSIFGVTGGAVTTAGTIPITTTVTSGGLLYGSSTTQVASSGAMTANAFVTGGGAGVAPNAVAITGLVKGNGASAPAAAVAGTDYPGLATSNTYTAAQATTPVVGGSVSGTVTPDATAGNDWTYTLTGATTIANPTGIKAGQTFNYQLTQGGSGTNTIGLGSVFKFAGATAPTWSTAAGKIDILTCRSFTTTYLFCGAAIDVR